MTVAPIAPISGIQEAAGLTSQAVPSTGPTGAFGRMLMDGVGQVNQSVVDADKMVKAFALGDDVPLHQVTFALEQARISTEMMMHVRSRLLEGYQEIMRMQL